MNNENPNRKSPRADFHDYSGGNYFITICTADKEHFFGKIYDGTMYLSEIGKVANDKLATLHKHYSYIEVPLHVVMPNHIHAIIRIAEPPKAATNADAPTDANADAPTATNADAPGCVPTMRTALSVVVGGYKQSVTMYARRNNIEFGWQSRYHDHIIRGKHDGNRIDEYIRTNVARWDTDCFNPLNKNVGTHGSCVRNDVGTHPGASAAGEGENA